MASQKLIEDFNMFRDHCFIIRRNYNTYNDLFLSGEGELLNKTSPVFFDDISKIMIRDWILQVCLIMDKAKKTKRETISIELLNNRLHEEDLLTAEIEKLSNKLLAYGHIIKPARNKIIVHFDRKSVAKGTVLGKHNEKQLTDFVDDLQQYCDEVGRAIGISPQDFSVSGCEGDVLDLLRALREYHKNTSTQAQNGR